MSIAVVASLTTAGLVALTAIRVEPSGAMDMAALQEDVPVSTQAALQVVPVGPTLPVAERRTSCETIVHVGDSTSIGMNSPDTLPNPADRVVGRYQQVGGKKVIPDIVGARSSLETVNGEPNAVTSIEAQLARGTRGCWVMAMGINDTANIEVGGPGTVDSRIDRLLGPLKDQQVMWPTVITTSLNENPAYNNRAMQKFNKALVRACKRYPNLRVYDWASEAGPTWFADGIHYTAAGYTQRAYRFAVALATVFPATDAAPQGCLLKTSDVQKLPAPPASATRSAVPAATSSTTVTGARPSRAEGGR